MKAKCFLTAATIALLYTGTVTAATPIVVTETNTTVTQNFDSASDKAIPDGWAIDVNRDKTHTIRSWNDAQTTTDNDNAGPNLASNQKNGSYFFFSSSDNNDLALGGITTGTGTANGADCITVMTALTNGSSTPIDRIDISYAIEKYRYGNNGAGWEVSLYYSLDGTNWTAAGSDFQNLYKADSQTIGADIVPILTDKVENKVLMVDVAPQATLYLAWMMSVATGDQGSGAQAFAIDDVSLAVSYAKADAHYIYVENATKQSPLTLFAPEFPAYYGENPGSATSLTKTVNGVTYSVWDVKGNSPYDVTIMAGSNTVGTQNVKADADTYLCAAPEGLSVISDPDSYTGWVDPSRPPFVASGIFIRGEVNSWNPSQEWEFSKESDNFYVLYDKTLNGQFKVADASWSASCNYGSNGSNISVNQPYSLVSGTDSNISTGNNTIECIRMELTIEDGKATLLLVGEGSSNIQGPQKKGFVLDPEYTVLVPENPEKVKVLSLNNSLIHYNDQARMFNEIAQSLGVDATWTKHTNLGKTLQYHWEEGEGLTPDGQAGAKMTIRSDAWSHIILQEQTALPRTNFEAFRSSVKQWVEYIRANCPNPNAVIILPMNWHYAQDWSNFTENNAILLNHYKAVAEEFGVVVCPIAVAYQAKFDKDGGQITESEWFLPGDDRHPTIRATYMAACMEYGLIFDIDPTSITYYPTYTTEYDSKAIDNAVAADMRLYAKNALKAYANAVDHHASTVKFNAALYDDKGESISGQTISYSVDNGTITADGLLSTEGKAGTYTVTATCGDQTKTATVIVTKAETEVPVYPSIAISVDSPVVEEDFDLIGLEAEAKLPEGWRIDRQLSAPRTVGAFSTAVENTMYAGGVNLPSNAKNGLWNFGADASTDRAVGGITTGVDGGTRAVNLYTHLINDGKKPFGSLDISYDVEKYRKGVNAAGFAVQLYYSFDGRNWTSAGDAFRTFFEADAATEGYAEVPGDVKSVEASLPVNFGAGMDLYLAWNISVASGSDAQGAMALAIDNVSIEGVTPAVPEYKYHIYVDDRTTYEALGLYAWGDSELFGAWPGQAPIDEQTIDGIEYKVFGHDADSGSFSFIFNNWNQGKQLPDVKVEGGKDYFFQITDAGASISANVHNTVGIVGFNITVEAQTIHLPTPAQLNVYALDGTRVLTSYGTSASLQALQSGIYVVVAETSEEKATLKVRL